ncbi:MAG: hypothetical protein PHY23_00840 [Oscillospiraceae bacterium]|nr:hypothetical protein [Oscillospiraceae bacterium]
MGNTWNVEFTSLPQNLIEMQAMREAAMDTPYAAAALIVAALCAYPTNKEAALEMLDFLKGPQPLSAYDKQFLADRLRGKPYLPLSYFKGATPENGYTPDRPYVITVRDNPHSYAQKAEGYVQLYLQSSGADSPRPVKLREKPSTGQWFLWEQMLLSDIRPPKSADPWA